MRGKVRDLARRRPDRRVTDGLSLAEEARGRRVTLHRSHAPGWSFPEGKWPLTLTAEQRGMRVTLHFLAQNPALSSVLPGRSQPRPARDIASVGHAPACARATHARANCSSADDKAMRDGRWGANACSSTPSTCCRSSAGSSSGGGGPVASGACFRERQRACRTRSAALNLSMSLVRRLLLRRFRHARRHFVQHVCCVFAAEAFGWNHFLHSIHRRL